MVRAAASDAEVLRHRDVASMSAGREAPAGRHVRDPPAARRRCGVRPGTSAWHRGQVDASRTLRASLRRLGEPAEIEWRRRGSRPRRVVLLVDVSGSMSGVRRRAAAPGPPADPGACGDACETFTIGTRLTHLTRAMRLRDPERALVAAGETVPDWSGGTRLGETLRFFLDRWGQRGMARGAVVVVFSDGWERGDAALLGEQMARLQPDRAPRGLGQPAPRQGRATRPSSRACSRPCPTATTSSPATRWRRTPSWSRWSSRCVRCCPSCWSGGAPARRSASAPWSRPSSRAPRPPGASMLVGPDEHGGRLGLRRLRRGRGLRAGPGGRRRPAPRCCSATASPTTTRSPSA